MYILWEKPESFRGKLSRWWRIGLPHRRPTAMAVPPIASAQD